MHFAAERRAFFSSYVKLYRHCDERSLLHRSLGVSLLMTIFPLLHSEELNRVASGANFPVIDQVPNSLTSSGGLTAGRPKSSLLHTFCGAGAILT